MSAEISHQNPGVSGFRSGVIRIKSILPVPEFPKSPCTRENDPLRLGASRSSVLGRSSLILTFESQYVHEDFVVEPVTAQKT